MIGWLRKVAGLNAASPVASDPLPTKAPTKQALKPSYLTTANPSPDSPLRRSDRLLANKDILDYRVGNDSRQVIRDFARVSPELSAAVTAYVRTGITSGHTAVAYNMDGTSNPEATDALAQIITRLDVLNDYTIGYDDSMSIRSLCETWARDLVQGGACCGELVLNKARLPSKIQPVAQAQIRLFPSKDGQKLIPKQFLAGEYIDLDIPTFFMITLDADLQEAYPISPIEPAIQAVLFSADFVNDVRRVLKKAIHPRQVLTIDEELFRKSIPQEFQNDAVKLQAYMDSVILDIESKLNTLKPEEVLVMFSSLGLAIVDHGNTNLSQEYQFTTDMANGKLSAGAKVLPTVMGQGNATSNTASAETLLFMKYVEGTVWAKLNEMLSKILTLAVRLLGHDVTVTWTFNPIDLRPENELESFKSMKQSRILELLSLGLITDDVASILLTGRLPPKGMKPLSGTSFFSGGAKPAGDGFNGASNSGSTMNQKTKSDAPQGAKGKNGGQPGP